MCRGECTPVPTASHLAPMFPVRRAISILLWCKIFVGPPKLHDRQLVDDSVHSDVRAEHTCTTAAIFRSMDSQWKEDTNKDCTAAHKKTKNRVLSTKNRYSRLVLPRACLPARLPYGLFHLIYYHRTSHYMTLRMHRRDI